MSWLFSRALVEEYSEESCLAGAPCALWKTTHTPPPSWLPARMTEHLSLSQSGMTYAPLTESLGEAVLMSFLAAFPAKISALQGKATASMESEAVFGEKWQEWFAKWNPSSSLWKTRQLSLFEGSEMFSETWPAWGMMQDGECSELPTPERHTVETEYGLWPTPAARDYKGANGWETTKKKLAAGGRPHKDQLPNAVQLAEGKAISGTLNPEWVEWLMGWPPGHTALEPLGTDKFQQWSSLHGKR